MVVIFFNLGLVLAFILLVSIVFINASISYSGSDLYFIFD